MTLCGCAALVPQYHTAADSADGLTNLPEYGVGVRVLLALAGHKLYDDNTTKLLLATRNNVKKLV